MALPLGREEGRLALARFDDEGDEDGAARRQARR
jgi:hypothetical protein